MEITDITDDLLEDHIDKIIDVMDNIKLNRLSILTGENGCGKSFIRKQIPFRIMNKLGVSPKDESYKSRIRHIVKSVSMQKRTESMPDWGALSSVFHDLPWQPTSYSTYHMIEALINCLKQLDNKDDKSYFIIDEPEIGMSRESQLGLANSIKSVLPYILENSLGIMLITHSDIIVDTLKDDADFHYLGINEYNKDVDAWLNRGIAPTDFTFLSEWSNRLYKCIENRLNKPKQ